MSHEPNRRMPCTKCSNLVSHGPCLPQFKVARRPGTTSTRIPSKAVPKNATHMVLRPGGKSHQRSSSDGRHSSCPEPLRTPESGTKSIQIG